MRFLLVITTAILASTCAIALAGNLPAGGWAWDLMNGLGIAACVLLVHLSWTSASPARQPGLQIHTWLAIVISVLVTVHGAALLVTEPILLEYLEPDAPAYMWAGIVAWVLLVLLTATSYPGPRRRLFRRHDRFRLLHRLAWSLVLALCLWHVVGSGFYLSTPAAGGLFVAVVAGPALWSHLARRHGLHAPREIAARPASATLALTMGALGAGTLFAVVRNI